jgi:lipoprotein NlpD
MKQSLSALGLLLLFSFTTLTVTILSGCVSASRHAPAPIEDRQRNKQAQISKPAVGAPNNTKQSTATNPPVPVDPVPKSAYYVVKPGDTLIKIGLEQGQSWRDIIRWNSIDNPNLIEVGQILRVLPPVVDPGTSEPVVVKPVTSPSQVINSNSENKAPASVQQVTPSAVEIADENTIFSWPANGNLSGQFDDLKNKGIDITGKTGDAVYASADGRVVYAGAGLRGYGNLIILKHANNYLTAYAHNQTLLVREDQSVKRGQKIAEMGNSDSEQVKLHFEIRKQGKPVDPIKLLPAR